MFSGDLKWDSNHFTSTSRCQLSSNCLPSLRYVFLEDEREILYGDTPDDGHEPVDL